MTGWGARLVVMIARISRIVRLSKVFVGLVVFALPSFAQAPPVGVPRNLARERAQRIIDVRYELSFTLTAHANTAVGKETLKFRYKQEPFVAPLRPTTGPLLLDFRGGTISKMVLNGKTLPVKMENGHIEIPQDLLKTSKDTSSEGLESARKAAVATDNLGRPVGQKPDAKIPDSPDDNVIAIDFTAPVGTAGTALTRYDDKDDNSEYIYTLFVPMDASMAFPCFDQPDLKAEFHLTVIAPEDWVVISNTDFENLLSIGPGKRLTVFNRTPPISTYLFAFAAGPFARIHPREGMPGVYIRQSQLKRAIADGTDIQEVAKQGMKYLADYFDQAYPFEKYDMVLIPGFPYGGMEHAGATFLREESVLFRTAPTHNDVLNRDILVLHELTHQWFGDLVTMRWFDDLWLKEGFAQYMAYHALADLKPKEDVWKRFYQSIKPAAYAIDSTQGTTPIYQDIPNLKDAKSAYGAIVYSKAPGVMRQLNYVIGEKNFRDALRSYLKNHSYSNAEWNDLVHEFEKSSGKPLQKWADVYIKRRGMPQVNVAWSCSPAHRISHFELSQHDVLNEGGVWPIATEVLLSYGRMKPVLLRAELNGPKAEVRSAIGKPCPAFVFANNDDYAYGRFLLDARSRGAVMRELGGIHDTFERALLWGSLWDSVRQAELNPRAYIDLALRLLPEEKDEQLAQSVIGRTITALHRYVPAQTRAELAPRMETLASNEMLHAADPDMRIIWFRALRSSAETPKARGELKDLLAGKLTIPGVQLRQLDRWSMVEQLIAMNDPDAGAVLAAEEKRDPSGEGQKFAFMAKAARPDAAGKKKYFDDYMHDATRPEDWVSMSLGAFNYWNQPELTLPYLRPALDALPQVKRDRKIFFLLAWLNAFIGGQQSAEAQQQVNNFLNTAQLDKDLRLKVLEVKDELDRTVKIQEKYNTVAKTRRPLRKSNRAVGASGQHKAEKVVAKKRG
ncbi:MAG TPA: M1 family aminopeptidase [Candidatus Angelobacter sp.]|nr:M1 family aminopeptidase [Candidatus Angelobacter sp.]